MSEVDTTAANATENVNTTEPVAEAPKTETPAEAPKDNGLGLTAEQAEQFKKFLDANGGYNKVFAKIKQDVTGRDADKKEEPASQPEQKPATSPEQPTQPEQPAQPAEGYVTPQAFMAKQYFKALAAEEGYQPIAKEIESGAVLKEMENLGIKATDAQGNFNERQIRLFLDLKAKTIPPTPSVVEPTTTPTVTFTTIEGDITSMEQAQKIIMESAGGRARGAGEHPRLEEAKKFIAAQFNKS